MNRSYAYLHGHTFSFNAINLHWRALKWGTFLILALVLDASAMSANELTKCLKKGGGIYAESECRARKIVELKQQQQVNDRNIRLELSDCKPTIFGYDYSSALENYAKAQKNWALFSAHNCSLVRDTFGQGTAYAGIALNCDIKLREQNLERTNKFLKELRDTRSMLLEENKTAQFKDSPAIVCK